MDERRRGYKPISNWPGIWDMEPRTALGDNGIDRKDAVGKGRQHIAVEPCSKHRSLRKIAPFDQENTYLQLLNGDCR